MLKNPTETAYNASFMQQNCFSVDETVLMNVYDLLGMQNKSYFYYFVVVTSHDFVFVVKGAEGRPVRKIIL